MDFSPQTEPDQHAAFAQALAGFTPGRPVTVLCHFDADGLSAGALFARGLARAGHEPALRLVGRGEDPWSAEMGRELADAAPGGLVATDLGVRRDPLAPGVPTVLVDHHVPQGLPDGQTTVVTGYGQDPTPCSALLAHRCLAGVTDMDPDLWLAALGTIGDLGERAPFAELAEAKRRHGAKLLREATSLINAPRRSASGDATPALNLLMKAKGPGEVVSGEHPETAILQAARGEVKEALEEARRAPPRFAGQVALVQCHSPCQIHPLLAQSWAGRLRRNVVIAANTGFRPGKVHFAARTATDTDLVAFLAKHAPPGAAGPAYGQGHRQASGGALDVDGWALFLEGLGFRGMG